MTDTLFPCPFCGGNNISIGSSGVGDGGLSRYVKCEECSATVQGIGVAASAAWDRRPTPPVSAQSVAADTVATVREAAFREVAEAIQKADPFEAADVAWGFVGRALKSSKEA